MARVSNRILAELIGLSRQRGLPVDDALATSPVPLAELKNPKSLVEWSHFAQAVDILEDLAGGPPDGIADLARAMDRPDALGAVGRLFRFAVTPRQLYQVAVRFTAARAFPTHAIRFEVFDDERLQIEISIDESEPGCAAFFHGCRGYFEIAPRLLGLPNALVESEIEPRHARFLVTPPPSPSLPSRLRRIWELFRASEAAIGELRELHESLTAKSLELTSARTDLEDSERRFVEVFQGSPAPMVIVPLEGDRLLDANEAFLRASGLRREELTSRRVQEMPFWSSESDAAELRSLLRDHGPLRALDFPFRGRHGEPRRGLLSSSSSRFAGKPVVLIQVVDVTDSREQEERERQSQKMEIVGQLAGGVAHDFNNLLTVISGSAEQQLACLDPKTEGHDAAQEIFHAAGRASKLTAQLLAFARRQILNPRRIGLNDPVRGLLEMLRRLIGEDIVMRAELGSDLPSVLADPGQLEQVLLNLVLNARDAMPSGGQLTIRTRRARPSEVGGAEGAEHQGGEHLALSVADTGVGLDPEVLPRIFEPFFTTKAPDQGTGLGLATVQGIVTQSGGRLHVESEPGAGTTVTVFLPATHGSEQISPDSIPVVPEPGRGKTVLLAEDEDAVRRIVARQLENGGYTVLVAASGLEALELEASHDGPVHVLLTDMVMPGMGGPELYEELRRRRPGVRTLFMSGYPLDQSREGGPPILGKPFGFEALGAALDSILASEDGT